MTSNLRTKRVLIVDDEPNVAAVLAEGLEELGEKYIIETASSGAEALAKINQHTYALIITDYRMPGLNGLDLARAVRHTSPGTQIVMMTAYGSDELREEIGKLELSGFVDKPFAVTQVREIVQNVLGGEADQHHVLVVEDNEELRNLYTRTLRRSGYQVHTAATLQEARDSLSQRDFAIVLCDIHMGRERSIDLVRERGEELKQKGTQIIIVSAEAGYFPMLEDAGVEFYLEKPVAIGTLVTLVDRLVAQR